LAGRSDGRFARQSNTTCSRSGEIGKPLCLDGGSGGVWMCRAMSCMALVALNT
jgi:hypothetical protein